MRRPPQRASGAAYKARLNGHDGDARGNDGNGEATYTLPLRSSRDRLGDGEAT
jgi:hypothetical protein